VAKSNALGAKLIQNEQNFNVASLLLKAKLYASSMVADPLALKPRLAKPVNVHP